MHLITLEQATLRSQVLRTTILTAFFFCFALLFFTFSITSPMQFHDIFGSTVPLWVPTSFLLMITVYFSGIRYLFKSCLARQLNFPTSVLFLTAFIETSIPTIVICLIAQIHIPAYLLLSPPIMVYFIFIFLSALSLDQRLCYFTGIVASFEYASLAFYFLNYTEVTHIEPFLLIPENFVSRSMILLAGGVVTAFVTNQIKTQLLSTFNAIQERDQIAHVFGRHVSPEVVNMLLTQGSNPLGESRFVCVMFLDIRNFTSYAENKNPQEVVNYLNQLFGSMIEIVNANQGIINKFLGDGLMAVFGAPVAGNHDTDNAVRAAEQIIKQIDHEVSLGTIANTKIGIGLHCGIVVTGTVGAPRRQEYTIIGDVVNLAARIEQLNKNYNSQLLISEEVYLGLQEKRGSLLGDIPVKGRQQPIKVYQLI
jgi:adenylate cyclase